MQSRRELTVRLATPLLTAAVLTAVVAGPVSAKELAAARACDDDGCRTITAAAALRGMDGGEPTSAPDKRAPFYRVRMRVRVEGAKDFRYTLLYVPAAGLVRVRGQWNRYDWLAVTPSGRRGFDRLTRGLKPEPAAQLRRGVGAERPLPAARVDEVVPPPAPGPGGGFPWTVVLIAGALALAGAGVVARRASKHGLAPGHTPLARDDVS